MGIPGHALCLQRYLADTSLTALPPHPSRSVGFQKPQNTLMLQSPWSGPSAQNSPLSRFFPMPALNSLATATHEDLLGNPHYKALYEQARDLHSRHESLLAAYHLLATTIPQVFTVIPNPMGITAPVGLPGVLPITPNIPEYTKEQLPEIKFWKSKDWKTYAANHGDFLTIKKKKDKKSDSDNEDEDEAESETGDAKLNVLGFLEHDDGTPFEEEERDHVRQCAREIFITLQAAQRAPLKWSLATAEVTAFFRGSLAEKVPAVAFAHLNWKVDVVGTVIYAQWSHYWREALKAQHPNRAVTSKPSSKRCGTPHPDAPRKKKRSKTDHQAASSSTPSPPSLPDSDSLIHVKAWAAENNNPSQTPLASSSLSSPSPAPSSSPAPTSAVPVSISNRSSHSAPSKDNIAAQPKIPFKSKVVSPLDNIFEEEVIPAARLKDMGSSSGPPIIPNASTILKAADKKSTKHVPGTADTAWNLFGHDYLKKWTEKKNPATSAKVREAFDALPAAERQRYTELEKQYKAEKKDTKKRAKEAGETSAMGPAGKGKQKEGDEGDSKGGIGAGRGAGRILIARRDGRWAWERRRSLKHLLFPYHHHLRPAPRLLPLPPSSPIFSFRLLRSPANALAPKYPTNTWKQPPKEVLNPSAFGQPLLGVQTLRSSVSHLSIVVAVTGVVNYMSGQICLQVPAGVGFPVFEGQNAAVVLSASTLRLRNRAEIRRRNSGMLTRRRTVLNDAAAIFPAQTTHIRGPSATSPCTSDRANALTIHYTIKHSAIEDKDTTSKLYLAAVDGKSSSEAREIVTDRPRQPVCWHWDLPRTREGYYRVTGGVEVPVCSGSLFRVDRVFPARCQASDGPRTTGVVSPFGPATRIRQTQICSSYYPGADSSSQYFDGRTSTRRLRQRERQANLAGGWGARAAAWHGTLYYT
ncbi:hypothetical protein DFH07DRAFT_1008619 [Mycena maculata]|uniref:Uncharacterized protein n=1 Tax=Mycena maculata TaxID=230809 RepID=A0AAD7HH51_9AGAR|nr:hypothetical protein DFH07DRAFT_1008619 [Mycena maculata]